jgi:hypothetical protein
MTDGTTLSLLLSVDKDSVLTDSNRIRFLFLIFWRGKINRFL